MCLAAAGYFILMRVMEQVVVAVIEGIGKAIVTVIQVIIVGIISSLTRGIRRGASPHLLQPTNVFGSSHSASTRKKTGTGKILLVHMRGDKMYSCLVRLQALHVLSNTCVCISAKLYCTAL